MTGQGVVSLRRAGNLSQDGSRFSVGHRRINLDSCNGGGHRAGFDTHPTLERFVSGHKRVMTALHTDSKNQWKLPVTPLVTLQLGYPDTIILLRSGRYKTG